MKKLNQDVVTRDNIIFGSYDKSKYSGGIRHFKNLSLDKLKLLVKDNFADTEDAQNWAPTIGEMIDFMTKYSGYTAHGYVVEIERPDYRVSLEGVSKESAADSLAELQDFSSLFKEADELVTENMMYCWFD